MVDDGDPRAGLAQRGWVVANGETYCARCAASRGLAQPPGEEQGDALVPPAPAEPAALSAVNSESRVARALRMMGASFTALREEPRLVVFPAVSMVLSLIVGVVCFTSFVPGGHGAAGARDALLVPSLVAAYPLTFVSVYCSVAMAAMLGARLDGHRISVGEGFSAANQRIGAIAAWALLACTVGAALRLLEERLPLAGRIAAGVFGLAWSLATLFAVPVLAYEHRGALATVGRSTEIFKRRWGAQIGGTAGIGVIGGILAIPFLLLIFVGATRPSGGAGLIVLGGAGMFAVVAGTGALEQIYRVFVYRSAVGLDAAGPFSASDLQQPLTRRGR